MTHAAVYWMKAKTWSIVLKSSVVAGHARAGEIAFVKPVNGTDVAEVRVLKVGSEYDWLVFWFILVLYSSLQK